MSKPTVRKLAAVISTDIVGYSRLMEADEAGTLARMKAYRQDLWTPVIERHGGRIVGSAGDALLIEYASAVAAVESAIEMQDGMTAREADLPGDGQMLLRIGVNIGEVVVEGDDIFGDGVNVAARLQAMAPPGGICISGKVYDEIEGKLSADFADDGEHAVKNITRPVRVWKWFAPATGAAGSMEDPADHRAVPAFMDKPAIAVLPFANLSPDPQQEYFSDGLTDEIIAALTHWRSFPVIARNSTAAYKNKAVDIKQAARELGVRYLLKGSVQKQGNRLRVTAQLVDASTGYHVWAETYDRELDDVFAVQDDIVQRIAALIAPQLARAELQRSISKPAEVLDAWDLYLRALPLLRKRIREDNAKARELLSRAIAIRPDYADAHAGLAMSHNMDILINATDDHTRSATQAIEAARKAIECDEASSWAHHELSTAYQWLNRIDDALAEARISVNLNPNDAYALHALGNKSDLAGDPNGIAYMERAQKLNPADAGLHGQLTFLARAYVNIGDYDAAVERARHAIRRRPDYAPAYYILAIALGLGGALEEARAALATCDELSPGFTRSRQDWQPYADPASNERLREGLRRIERQK